MENVGGYINTFSIPMGESKMDTDYIEETIRKELIDNGIKKKGLAVKISESIKKEIFKFHEYQNKCLMNDLLTKQIRIDKLEQRIDAKASKHVARRVRAIK